MAKLLGKEVLITNSKLIRFASEYGLKLTDLSELNIASIIDLVAYCSDLTVDEIEAELDKDLAFAETLAKVVTDSLQIRGGSVEKQTVKPMKKVSR